MEHTKFDAIFISSTKLFDTLSLDNYQRKLFPKIHCKFVLFSTQTIDQPVNFNINHTYLQKRMFTQPNALTFTNTPRFHS